MSSRPPSQTTNIIGSLAALALIDAPKRGRTNGASGESANKRAKATAKVVYNKQVWDVTSTPKIGTRTYYVIRKEGVTKRVQNVVPYNDATKREHVIGSKTFACWVRKLTLSRQNLQSLPPTIGDAQWLGTLNLSHNSLSILPNSLATLQRLEHLDLSFNPLTNFSLPQEFSNLKALKTLNLSVTQLTTLPSSFVGLTSLESLLIDNSKLDTLPPNIGGLASLGSLRLVNNKLQELPSSICELTQLSNLVLAHNDLRSLPPDFGNLNLKSLWINFNKLERLPDSIGNLSKLTSLYLNNNQLTKLPNDFGKLTALVTLHLENNSLVELPANFHMLRNLFDCRLDYNKLTHLPPLLFYVGTSHPYALAASVNVHVELQGNPFVDPPIRIIKQGWEATRNYLRDNERIRERMSNAADEIETTQSVTTLWEYKDLPPGYRSKAGDRIKGLDDAQRKREQERDEQDMAFQRSLIQDQDKAEAAALSSKNDPASLAKVRERRSATHKANVALRIELAEEKARAAKFETLWKDEHKCAVCREFRTKLGAAMPCGHRICKGCALQLRKLECPICRHRFRQEDLIAIHASIRM